MRRTLLLVSAGCIVPCMAMLLRADELQMNNGDRYFGKVLSMSADSVSMQSEMLGTIKVPRTNVVRVAFGTNVVSSPPVTNFPRVSVPTNHLASASAVASSSTNVDLSPALRSLGVNTNFIHLIRQQMLSANPAAAGKYDELVNGLLSGKLNMDDLRRQAQASVDQLRSLKHDLGPDADESLDGYLKVLDFFLKQTGSAPTNAATAPGPSRQ